jgi:hypothetical protein
MNWNIIILGAISGLCSAIIVDVDAYRKVMKESPDKKFDWGLALVRWVQGMVSGALVSFAARGPQ